MWGAWPSGFALAAAPWSSAASRPRTRAGPVGDTGGYGDGGMVLNTPHGLVTPAPLMAAGPLMPGMPGI